MQLVLHTHGLSLQVRKGIFRVSGGDNVRDISPELVSSIAVTAPCVISSAALMLAAKAEIPIYVFDRFGDAVSCMRSPYFESLATLRRKQVYFSDQKEGAAWVIRQFERKLEGQVSNLRYLARRRRREAELLDATVATLQTEAKDLRDMVQRPTPHWASRIMGWEGNVAKNYWQALAAVQAEPFRFSGRSRRPAQDPFNALVNYGYGMLYALTEQALFGSGLDPHLGILHADEYDRPTLAFDLIEPFRPWIDRLILELLLKKEVEVEWFEQREEGYWLSLAGKKRYIPAFNEWMLGNIRWESRQMSRTAHMYRVAAELAKLIDLTTERPT